MWNLSSSKLREKIKKSIIERWAELKEEIKIEKKYNSKNEVYA